MFATYNKETECIGGIGMTVDGAWSDHDEYCDSRDGYVMCGTSKMLFDEISNNGGVGVVTVFDSVNNWLELA